MTNDEGRQAKAGGELRRFAGPDELARAAAVAWITMLDLRGGDGRHFCVALPGGRVAQRFFRALAELGCGRREVFDTVHFFWGDERCVPPSDPESNFRLAHEHLLAPMNIPARHIHRIRGETVPGLAAAAAERELRGLAPLGANGQPVFDLVVLGMGEDGHVASLFPAEPESVMTSEAVYRPVLSPKPPLHRITLGYPGLQAAREVWVLISGPGKKEALRKSLSRGTATPLGRLLEQRPDSRLFTDIILEDG